MCCHGDYPTCEWVVCPSGSNLFYLYGSFYVFYTVKDVLHVALTL